MMLSGLVVWAVHFGGAYAIASAFDMASDASAPASRWTAGGLTLACLAADVAILWRIVRRTRHGEDDPVENLVRSLAGLGAAFSLVAVLWQGLPALIGV